MPVDKDTKAQARRANLVDYFTRKGYKLHREDSHGRYRVCGYQGLIVQENFYWRLSVERGGNAIDCLMNEFGLSFLDAISELTDISSSLDLQSSMCRIKEEELKVFKLPTLNKDQHRVFAYLHKTRGIKKELIEWLLKKGLLLQEKKHGNCGFPYYDFNNNMVGAEWVGTLTDKRFKKIDKSTDALSAYWFSIGKPKKLAVFESPIDMLSFITIVRDHPDLVKDPFEIKNTLFLSMSGLKYSIAQTFIDQFSVEEVFFCIDNDQCTDDGKTLATELFIDHFKDLEIPCRRLSPEVHKDWNEVLQAVK